ncbi:MAG: hypothetical protein V4667_06315 [Bacteroidota bacterium]
MKKIKLIFLFILFASCFFACKKYYPENDRCYTNYEKPLKEFLTKGTWQLDKYIVNGIDSTLWLNDTIKYTMIGFGDECLQKYPSERECEWYDENYKEKHTFIGYLPPLDKTPNPSIGTFGVYSIKKELRQNYKGNKNKYRVIISFYTSVLPNQRIPKLKVYGEIVKINENELIIENDNSNKYFFKKL